MLPTLRGARVLGLLDGIDAAPAEKLEIENTDDPKKKTIIDNPAYLAWL